MRQGIFYFRLDAILSKICFLTIFIVADTVQWRKLSLVTAIEQYLLCRNPNCNELSLMTKNNVEFCHFTVFNFPVNFWVIIIIFEFT